MSDAYVPVPSGAAVSIETLRLALERLGHTVYIFAPHFPTYKDSNSHVARLPALFASREKYRPVKWPVFTTLKPNRIAELKLDIVHSHYFFDTFELAVRLAKLADVPLVGTFYRILPEIARKKSFWSSAQKNSEKVLLKTINYANRCDQLVSLSQESKKYLEEFSVSTPIENIPVGIFPKDFVALPSDAIKERFKIPKTHKLILFVGRVDDDSNLNLLKRYGKQ